PGPVLIFPPEEELPHLMIPGVRWVGVVTAMLAVASVCPAAESPTDAAKPADSGYRPGSGGIGGHLGVSDFVAGGDFSAGAQPRLSFAAHWRYAFTSWLRGQVRSEEHTSELQSRS